MKKNNNKEEADFEKQEFAPLIDKIRSINKEEAGEDFDKKFFEKLDKIELKKPFKLEIKDIITKIYQIPNFKIYLSVGLSTAIILIFFYLIFNTPQITAPVIPPEEKTLSKTDSINTQNQTPNNNLNETQLAENKKTKKSLLDIISNNRDDKSFRALNQNETIRKSLNKIINEALKSGLFK